MPFNACVTLRYTCKVKVVMIHKAVQHVSVSYSMPNMAYSRRTELDAVCCRLTQLSWANSMVTDAREMRGSGLKRARLCIRCVVSRDPFLAVQVERALGHLVPHVIYPEAVHIEIAVVTSVES